METLYNLYLYSGNADGVFIILAKNLKFAPDAVPLINRTIVRTLVRLLPVIKPK